MKSVYDKSIISACGNARNWIIPLVLYSLARTKIKLTRIEHILIPGLTIRSNSILNSRIVYSLFDNRILFKTNFYSIIDNRILFQN